MIYNSFTIFSFELLYFNNVQNKTKRFKIFTFATKKAKQSRILLVFKIQIAQTIIIRSLRGPKEEFSAFFWGNLIKFMKLATQFIHSECLRGAIFFPFFYESLKKILNLSSVVWVRLSCEFATNLDFSVPYKMYILVTLWVLTY